MRRWAHKLRLAPERNLERGRVTAANRDHGDGRMGLPRIEPDHRMTARFNNMEPMTNTSKIRKKRFQAALGTAIRFGESLYFAKRCFSCSA